MKAIKKVEVTPIDYNIGKIIDSASTTDDKTKNTYSMRIIDNKESNLNSEISNKANSSDVYTKNEINDIFYDTSTNYKGTWDGYANDFSTTNSTSSSLLVLHDSKIQKRTISNIISDNNIITTGNISEITGTLAIDGSSSNSKDINYPTGYNMSNCVPIAIGISDDANGYAYGSYVNSTSLLDGVCGSYHLKLKSSNMKLLVSNIKSSSTTVNYKIVLMKIS